MYCQIKVFYNRKYWYYNKWFGVTYSSQIEKKNCAVSFPDEIQHPFNVHVRDKNVNMSIVSSIVRCYAKLLVWTARYCYPLIYLLSHLRLDIFKNAQQASWAFQQILQKEQQNLLCLPRSIFIATTSKRFREHGTMYIGVFLPSRNMHAWVIEDNMQTDGLDNNWILYQPLIMMYG